MKRFKSAYVVLSLLWVLVLTGTAQASIWNRDILTMSPGEATVRQFLLYDALDASELGPMGVFAVVGIGSDAAPLGNLTVTVTPNIKKDFGKVIDYTVIGFAYTFGGAFAMISGGSTDPLRAVEIVPLNGPYAFAIMAIFISSVDGPGDWEKPAEFTATFEMSAGEAPAAE